MSQERRLATAYGEARLVTDRASGPESATLLLSHGAGNGIDTPDLVALAEMLPAHGFTVIRLAQPGRGAGRMGATAPPTLDGARAAAAAAVATT
ncbi:MAG: hydrolase, partial [Nocardioides sp.]|nr:hydrolase [Nocardioides sp.]